LQLKQYPALTMRGDLPGNAAFGKPGFWQRASRLPCPHVARSAGTRREPVENCAARIAACPKAEGWLAPGAIMLLPIPLSRHFSQRSLAISVPF
jgi:hypothetical protein